MNVESIKFRRDINENRITYIGKCQGHPDGSHHEFSLRSLTLGEWRLGIWHWDAKGVWHVESRMGTLEYIKSVIRQMCTGGTQ